MGAEHAGGLLMRLTGFELQGRSFHLCLNGAALFDIYDKYGAEEPILSRIDGHDRAAYDRTCWILAKLAEQGELVRRFNGFDKGPFPSEHFFRTNLRPVDVPRAKAAIELAVRQGFAREEQEEEERIDLGLLELQKKTGIG